MAGKAGLEVRIPGRQGIPSNWHEYCFELLRGCQISPSPNQGIYFDNHALSLSRLKSAMSRGGMGPAGLHSGGNPPPRMPQFIMFKEYP